MRLTSWSPREEFEFTLEERTEYDSYVSNLQAAKRGYDRIKKSIISRLMEQNPFIESIPDYDRNFMMSRTGVTIHHIGLNGVLTNQLFDLMDEEHV